MLLARLRSRQQAWRWEDSHASTVLVAAAWRLRKGHAEMTHEVQSTILPTVGSLSMVARNCCAFWSCLELKGNPSAQLHLEADRCATM